MAWVPGGSFLMGSEEFYPEERPVREVSVDGFWIDVHPVTVADFRRFVKATGHVTIAERAPERTEYPDADPRLLVPGSLVFRPTRGPVDLRDFRNWWAYVPSACWRAPEGPGSDVYTRARHPVVHVAFDDASAYAAPVTLRVRRRSCTWRSCTPPCTTPSTRSTAATSRISSSPGRGAGTRRTPRRRPPPTAC
jgi:formylglycine-generating enzyme required for sulfatase activity